MSKMTKKEMLIAAIKDRGIKRERVFFDLLDQLGETQEQQAAVLGVSRRSIIRYKQGDPIPANVRRLAWMLVKHGVPQNVKGW